MAESAPHPPGDSGSAAVVATEARDRLLFEASPLPLWIYDVETLHFLDVNDVARG